MRPALTHRRVSVAAPPPSTTTTSNPAGAAITIPSELSKLCVDGPCTIQVVINNVTYNVGDTVNLPVGTTPATYVITDSLGNNATSTTSFTVDGPPSITAPASGTVNTTSPAGATVNLPAPSSTTCGSPPCTVAVVINGVKYNVGDPVLLPPGNTPLVYTITDSAGRTSTDTTSVDVIAPPSVNAPAPVSFNTTDPVGAPVTLQAPASVECYNPQCTIAVLINNVSYPVGSTVQLPVGTTTLTYLITDALGQTDTDTTNVTVLNPPGYDAALSKHVLSCDFHSLNVR